MESELEKTKAGRGVALRSEERPEEKGTSEPSSHGGFGGKNIPGVGASQEDGPAEGLWPSLEVGVRGWAGRSDGDEVKVRWQVEVGQGSAGLVGLEGGREDWRSRWHWVAPLRTHLGLTQPPCGSLELGRWRHPAALTEASLCSRVRWGLWSP